MNEALRNALEAVKSGQSQRARVILAEYLREDPQNVPAWVLLSKLATTEGQKTAFLRKILDLNPDHAYARQALADMGDVQPPAVSAGEPAAEDLVAPDVAMPEQDVAEQAGLDIEEIPEEDQFVSETVDEFVSEDRRPVGAQAEDFEEGEPDWLAAGAPGEEEAEDDLAGWLDSEELEDEELVEEEFGGWLDSEDLVEEESEEELADWLDSEALTEEESEEELADWLDSEVLGEEESEEDFASWLDSETLDDEELEEELAGWFDADISEADESEDEALPGWLSSGALAEEAQEESPGSLEPETVEAGESEEEALPSWLDAEALGQEDFSETEDTLFEAAAPAQPSPREESLEQEAPEWLREDDDEWFVEDEEKIEDIATASDAAASEKAARLSAAMSEPEPQPSQLDADAGSGRSWLLAILIFVAAVVFLLLVYAVLTLML